MENHSPPPDLPPHPGPEFAGFEDAAGGGWAAETEAWFEEGRRFHGDLGITLEDYRERFRVIVEELRQEGLHFRDDLAAARGLRHRDLYLALAMGRGREAAWRRFDRLYRPLLRHATIRWTGTPTEAEELSHQFSGDLFVCTRRPGDRGGLWSYRGRSTLATWLYTVLHRLALNARRHRQVEAGRGRHLRVGAPLLASPPTLPPDRAMEEAQLLERVRDVVPDALAALRPEERGLLRDYYVLELSQREIATLTGEAPGNVCRRLRSAELEAFREVRRRLRDLGYDVEETPLDRLVRETPSPLAMILSPRKRPPDSPPSRECP